MKLGNLGQVTLINGDLHFELDATIGGTAEAPLTAEVHLDEFIAMVQASVTNPMEKAALAILMGVLNTVNLQVEKSDLTAVPPWIEQLLGMLPGLIQIIIGALGAAPQTPGVQSEIAKLQLLEKTIAV